MNLHYAFQDMKNLYFVMDLMPGGDLMHNLSMKHSKKEFFTEEEVKFFIACVILGLKEMHKYEIIHKDLKPENLILDAEGYVHICDFGLARKCSE